MTLPRSSCAMASGGAARVASGGDTGTAALRWPAGEDAAGAETAGPATAPPAVEGPAAAPSAAGGLTTCVGSCGGTPPSPAGPAAGEVDSGPTASAVAAAPAEPAPVMPAAVVPSPAVAAAAGVPIASPPKRVERQSANWSRILEPTSWITPRPNCAGRPVILRSVLTTTLVPGPSSSRRAVMV